VNLLVVRERISKGIDGTKVSCLRPLFLMPFIRVFTKGYLDRTVFIESLALPEWVPRSPLRRLSSLFMIYMVQPSGVDCIKFPGLPALLPPVLAALRFVVEPRTIVEPPNDGHPRQQRRCPVVESQTVHDYEVEWDVHVEVHSGLLAHPPRS